MNQEWKDEDKKTEFEHNQILQEGMNPHITKEQCLSSIHTQLQRIKKSQPHDAKNLNENLLRLSQQLDDPIDSNQPNAICATQMSAKKGIQKFGQRALNALITEYEQLHDLKGFTPIQPKTLVWETKQSDLHAIDLIKEKRTGKLKGRTVADGRKQRPLYNKHEISSPTLSQDGSMATVAIDAQEGRHVGIADVAGAFLKTDQTDFVVVKFEGPAVDALLQIDHDKYSSAVIKEKGKKVLCVRLLKAMYGTLTAPILWYNLFSSKLKYEGFLLNSYDPCVANKMVNGKQMTICWYVDDLKVSHVDPVEVRKMMEILETQFGKMDVTYGNDQTYLGMDLKIRDKKVYISMKGYLEDSIAAFSEAINSAAKTPATRHLMVVEDAELLNEEKATIFHHIVAKLLHVAKRARLDIQPAIVFLSTRVKCPNVGDWRKLKRLLQYIFRTLDMYRILSIHSFSEMSVYIDASHAPQYGC